VVLGFVTCRLVELPSKGHHVGNDDRILLDG